MKKVENTKKLQEIVIYRGSRGNVTLRADINKDTIWATINQIGDLFGVQKAAVSKHIKNIFESGELRKKATVSILETVQREGNRNVIRNIEFYNLDMIISVGYRVNSLRGTQFRIWATQKLKEYIIKGFVMDDDRLESGKHISQLPFQPINGKPVYCFDCFKKMGGGRDSNRFQDRGPRRDEPRPQNNEQLDAINRKVDKILEILTSTSVKEKKETKPKTEEKAIIPQKKSPTTKK